ncbi:hypothetical protein VW35_10910 [Devosia soli]|uniref:Outer membrane protein beta-barrel domain-containing protein n=1 Tax=Devosia soli TaxID=361041 RepID=A0A0F5L7J5_9HYPH|nr:hypothetical protein [Devosia soli]KKB78174.1 hypothetical protein VW35_10910 [Devosia soli]
MLRFAVSLACLTLSSVGAAFAGPMPALPDLPPLPSDYAPQGQGGFYAGILTGYVHGAEDGLGLSAVIGNTYPAADLLFGLEAQVLAATSGDLALEGLFRGGYALTDTLSVFAVAGAGYSIKTGTFLSVGASLDADVGGGWLFRADYRYSHDLDGGPAGHKAMAGLLHTF